MEQKKANSNLCMGEGVDAQKQGVIKSILVSPMVLPGNTAIFKKMEHSIIKRISNVRMLNSFNTKDNKKIMKSDAYRFIPEGSVFFLNSLNNIEGMNYRSLPVMIGYNTVMNIHAN